MGVSGLWQVLQEADGVCVSRSAAAGQLGALCDELEGAVLAVDLSLLVCQAVTQPGLKDAGFDARGAVAKVTFERCSNLLRFGAVPVGVLEGRPPPEKLERLRQRNGGAHWCEANVTVAHMLCAARDAPGGRMRRPRACLCLHGSACGGPARAATRV